MAGLDASYRQSALERPGLAELCSEPPCGPGLLLPSSSLPLSPSPGVRPTPQSEGSSPAPSLSPLHPSLHLLLEGPELTHLSKSTRTPESQCPHWQNRETSDLLYLTRLSWGLNDVRHVELRTPPRCANVMHYCFHQSSLALHPS